MGRSGFHKLPGLRCLRAAAERTRHRRTANPKHSRGVRSESDGPQFGGNITRDDRSEEACVGGPGKILCRSGLCDNSVSAVDLKAICSRTTETDRPESCCKNGDAGESKFGAEFEGAGDADFRLGGQNKQRASC